MSHRFVPGSAAAALALALSGCSSESPVPLPSPSSSTPMQAQDAPSTPAGSTMSSDAPAMGSGMAASNPSEGRGVTEVTGSSEGTSSGNSDPGMENPDGDGSESDPGVMDPGGMDPGGMPIGVGAGAVPSAGCGKPRTLLDGNQTLVSGGMNRTYYLRTPSDYDSTFPYRVIFMFHWNYGSINAIVNPPDADQNTDRPFYGMGDLADGKTIFVVPQGLLSNRGGDGWENVNDRDVTLTDDMLSAISSSLCIDTSRVFTTGFSFGASMSAKLACVRADKFRAAVVYNVGFLSGNDAAECTNPIAYFQSHGVDDPILSYQTGLSILATFAGTNGCTALTPPTPPQNGHTCVSYQGCSVPTRFCTFGSGEGNPHNTSLRGHYPSAKDPGQTTSWIPAEAWSFITQF